MPRPTGAPVADPLESGLRGPAPGPDERQVYGVLDFALRAGEVLLAGGAGAADATATMTALADACGVAGVECDITFTSMTLSWVRSRDAAPVTSVRLVRRRSLDYARITAVHRLVDDVVERRVDPGTARARLDAIRAARSPYPGWLVTGFRAALAAAVAVLLGGGVPVAAAAFAATTAVDRVTGRLGSRGVPDFFLNVVGAALATGVAVALVAADVGLRPSLVVAGGIILLLPGVTLVGAVQDAITGFLVTATARALEVVLLTAGIVTGVAVALAVAVRVGVPVRVTEPASASLGGLSVQVLAAGAAAAAFAGANHAPRRVLATAGPVGAAGWACFLGLDRLDVPATFATGLSAVVVGVASAVAARTQGGPPLPYVAAGVIPLLPGLTIYSGMLALGQGDTIGGLVTLVEAGTLGLALAAGAILGEYLAQPRHAPPGGDRGEPGDRRGTVARVERRLLGPRLAGPLRWRHHRPRGRISG